MRRCSACPNGVRLSLRPDDERVKRVTTADCSKAWSFKVPSRLSRLACRGMSTPTADRLRYIGDIRYRHRGRHHWPPGPSPGAPSSPSLRRRQLGQPPSNECWDSRADGKSSRQTVPHRHLTPRQPGEVGCAVHLTAMPTCPGRGARWRHRADSSGKPARQGISPQSQQQSTGRRQGLCTPHRGFDLLNREVIEVVCIG